MWFRNLRLWQLDAPWDIDAEALATRLAGAAFSPCAPGQSETLGFEPVTGETEGLLCTEVARRQLLRTRRQERVLPGAAIAEVLAERVAELEAAEGGPVRGKRRSELADDVRAELLPRALLRSTRNWLLVDREHALVAVDTATPARGEALLSLLRGALGSLPLRPLTFAQPVAGALTHWLRGGDMPDGFLCGEWCDLEDPEDPRNKVRFRGQDLDAPDVEAALERGLRVTALELVVDVGAGEPFRAVLGEDGSLRRVRWPVGEAEPAAEEGPAARLDAELALLGMTLGPLVARLEAALGGRVAAE